MSVIDSVDVDDELIAAAVSPKKSSENNNSIITAQQMTLLWGHHRPRDDIITQMMYSYRGSTGGRTNERWIEKGSRYYAMVNGEMGRF